MGILLLLAALFLFGMRTEASEHYAYLSIEKFTLGQGYILEPTRVELVPGERMYQVLERGMSQAGIGWISDQNTTYGYYLRGIKNADSGSSHVPSCISAMTIKGQDGVTTAPKDKDVTSDKNEFFPNLEEMSYTCDSGWMYFINNTCPNIGFGGHTVQDGDVIRVQFTLFGIGRDVGNGYDEQSLNLPDRAEATKRLALVNDNRALCFSAGYQDAYRNAVSVVSDLDSSQDEIEQAISQLPTESMIERLAAGADDETLAKMVSRVEELIDAIGTVTLDREAEVNEAWQAYQSLSEELKGRVDASKVTLLEQAKQKLQELKDMQSVEAVAAKIRAIGDPVALKDESTITEARKAYNQLTATQKDLFNQTYESLVSKLTSSETALQDLKDTLAVSAVEEQIEAIGEVTNENYLSKLTLLAKAEGAYNQLTEAQKVKVSPEAYQQLVKARETVNAIYEVKNQENYQKFIDAVNQIGEVTLEKEAQINAAKKMYNRLTSEWQEKAKPEYQILQGYIAKLEELKTGGSGSGTGTGTPDDHETGTGTPTTSGKNTDTIPSTSGKETGISPATTTDSKKSAYAKTGTTVVVGGLKYKVTASSAKTRTVSVTGSRKAGIKTASIPAAITIGKYSYKVTGIASKAFSGKKKLTTIKVGKNVTSIGSKAFANCAKLKKITITGTKLKKVGSKALSGIHKKAVIKVPKKKLKAYKKLLKGKGQKKTVKIK